MTTITRSFLRQLKDEIDEALKPLGKKHNVVIETGTASFSEVVARFQLEVATIGKGGEVNSVDAENFKRYHRRYGLLATDLGRTFKSRGEQYTLIGCAPKSHKYPLLGKRADGKVFKFATYTVLQQLAKPTADKPTTKLPKNKLNLL